MSLIERFIAFLKSLLGNPYVWGGKGEILTGMKNPETWITGKEKPNGQSYVDRALAFYRKVVASGKSPILAFDCSGLVTYTMKQLGLRKNNVNAQSLYTECTKISKAQLLPGDLVFIYSAGKKKMGHVGVYIGDGYTIESYGRDKGVVKLALSKGDWTHYGRHPLLQGKAAEPEPEQFGDWTVSRVLKRTAPLMAGVDVKELKQRLAERGYLRSNTKDTFGDDTEKAVSAFQKAQKLTADGKAGKDTITALGGLWKG